MVISSIFNIEKKNDYSSFKVEFWVYAHYPVHYLLQSQQTYKKQWPDTLHL